MNNRTKLNPETCNEVNYGKYSSNLFSVIKGVVMMLNVYEIFYPNYIVRLTS